MGMLSPPFESSGASVLFIALARRKGRGLTLRGRAG